MSTLPEITQALCCAVAQRDLEAARSYSLMAAAKMSPERGSKVRRAFDVEAPEKPLKHWARVNEPRSPWTPEAVAEGVGAWLREAQHAALLAAHGERVLPLLLVGETRCGKTSSICGLAGKLGLQVNRMSLASVVGSHLGETPERIKNALREALAAPRALWLIDEIDGIGHKRNGGSSAAQEQALAVGTLLTEIESLPPSFMLAATSNTHELLDDALSARFAVQAFPAWADLSSAERLAFAESHGHEVAATLDSYADVVRAARAARVARIIENPTVNERGWPTQLEMA